MHDALQQLKGHRLFAKQLEGGKRVGWGAKTIPSGGYWARPRRLWAPAMTIVGDSAGMVNVPTLKGVHYAMHAGIYAADAIFEALKADSVNLDGYDETKFQKDATGLLQGSLFDRNDPDNPTKDYSYVFVPYCTGDVHAGNKIATYNGIETHHVGWNNITAFMGRILPTGADAAPMATT